MPELPQLLLIDDDSEFLRTIELALEDDFVVTGTRTPEEALHKLSPPPDLIVLDLSFSKDGDRKGMDVLPEFRRECPQVPVVMLTGHGDVKTAVECMRLGAADFILKLPLEISELRGRLQKALENGRLSRRVGELEREIHILEPRAIIGKSARILTVKREIEVAARNDSTVLLVGESGTGKELVARAIHANSDRSSAPFVGTMLNNLAPGMVESELFGHEKGAFTDAKEKKIGLAEHAHKGVLFLDEIGKVPLEIQNKLLRFLEERSFRRVGGTTEIHVDVQVIAATNRPLEQLVKEGRFLQDLYYRLKFVEVVVPPLRERMEDVPVLVEHFLDLHRIRGRPGRDLAPEAFSALQEYSWPGNVRELRAALEHALFRAEVNGHERIEVEDLPLHLFAADGVPEPPFPPGSRVDVFERLAEAELRYARWALGEAGGLITQAWELLGYNDRFNFAERIRRILDEHPQLADRYPDLLRKFKKRQAREA